MYDFIQQVVTSFTARAASYSVFTLASSHVSTSLKFITMGNREPLLSDAVGGIFVPEGYGDTSVNDELSSPEAIALVSLGEIIHYRHLHQLSKQVSAAQKYPKWLPSLLHMMV